MLSVSITILTVLLVAVSILIILIVLMQRPKQEGLGAAFGGGMMNDIAGAHTTDILQKGTVWLSVMFFSISIFLGILYTKQIADKNNVKVLDGVKQAELPPPPPPSIGEIPGTTPINLEDPAGGISIEIPPKTAPAPATEDDGKENGKGDSEGGTEDAPKPVEGSKGDETGQPAPAPSEDDPEPTPSAGDKPSENKPEPSPDSPPSSGASKGNPGPDSPAPEPEKPGAGEKKPGEPE